MPANLSPEYKAAEAAFRKARVPRERLEWLREMLRTIPKHKGTDHLQADIKGRIRELSDELEAPRRRATRGGPALVVRPEGAAQIALMARPTRASPCCMRGSRDRRRMWRRIHLQPSTPNRA